MHTIVDNLYNQLKTTPQQCAGYFTDNAQWFLSAPLNELNSLEEFIEQYWQPLNCALPDLERKPFINVKSDYNGDTWLASTGYFVGCFSNTLFDIPATHSTLYLRYTELVKLDNDKIAQYYCILDFIDVMDQANVNPLRPSLGHAGRVMPPTTMDGLAPIEDSKQQADQSLKLVNDMLNELGRFDGHSLTSMKLDNFWHSDFMWYGPAGIGTTRGIEGFRADHQGPFVFSFPDRLVDHKATFIAQGNYVATGGWPHMHGTHSVGGWLGLPPTNKNLSLRVMDIWRREGELLKENWVAIDIIDMCQQMGLDVFAMMRQLNK